MRLAVTVVCMLLVLATLGPATVGGEAVSTPGSAASAHVQPAVPAGHVQPAVEDSDIAENETTVVMDIQLEESGNATWTVSMLVPLETEEDERAFEDLGYEFVRGTADVGPSLEPFQIAAKAANETSEREMKIADGTERSLHIEESTGILQLRFQWISFARQSGSDLIVDDAFRTESGTWLPHLEADQVLVIRGPDSYLVDSAPIGPEDAVLRWEGPQTFHDEYFYIVYRADPGSPSPITPTPTPTPTPTATDTPPSPPVNGNDDSQVLLFIAILLFGGGLAAYYVVDRRRDRDRPLPGATLLESITTNGHGPTEGKSLDTTSESLDTAEDGGPASEAPPEPTPEDPFAGIDEELLSDEERVLRLIEANGGRMKQARIVKETDWSNAKVSQLLSAMDEDDEIDKLRIGRENLISLPDVDVEDFEN